MSTWQPAKSPGDADPRRVGDFLDRVTGAVGAPKAGTVGTVFGGWDQIVGSEVAAHASPRSLRDGVLVVEVDEPAWATQLGFLSPELLEKIHAATGSLEVSEIRFRVSGMAPVRDRRGRAKSRRDAQD